MGSEREPFNVTGSALRIIRLNYQAALNYAKKLKMIMPDNVDIQNLIHELSNKK